MTYRNSKLLELARTLPCQICGAEDGTVSAAHSNQYRDGKGKGLKAHDYRIASLCYQCHHEVDNGAKFNRQQKLDIWEQAHRKTIGLFFELNLIGVINGR